jgi:DNA topoisomerase IB
VWITTSPRGHLQATGRDAKGRKQYRYRPRFRETMESTKYEHMLEFAESLPLIRRTVNEHLALRGLPREKVLATLMYLWETTLIRVGNDSYAKENNSYGLTTLRDKHVSVEGSELRFHFKGKSGRTWKLQLTGRQGGESGQDLPGQELFQYVDEAGELHHVSSTDVNGQGDYRSRYHGKGFSDLVRDGFGRAGVAGIPEFRHQGCAEKGGEERHRACRHTPRQHADDLPQMLHSSGIAAGPTQRDSSCSK